MDTSGTYSVKLYPRPPYRSGNPASKPNYGFLSVLGCEDDDDSDDSMVEAELEHLPVSTVINSNNTSTAPHHEKLYTERNMSEKVESPKKSNVLSQQNMSDSNDDVPFNDDIQIIDLESRGEDESVSSFVRSVPDIPNHILHSVSHNGLPSASASYSDRDQETSSPHSVGSSSSPNESHARY